MLLANPKYHIDEKLDFTDKLHRLVYGAIYNLFVNGITKISTIDIDNYLSNYSVNYEYYKNKNGLQFLNDAEDFAQTSNFDYYYTRLKKLSALRYLKDNGCDVSDLYNEKITDSKKEIEMEEKFDEMNLSDIFNYFKAKMETAERVYKTKHTDKTTIAHENIDELLENFKLNPEVGMPLANDIMNTIVRGQRKGKLYISSSTSGGGKTRSQVGEACHLAYPFQYSRRNKKWLKNGMSKSILFIATEQEASEIQTLIPAYLADVNEEHILQGSYEEDEWERVQIAISIMKKYPNFYIEQIPNPNVSELQNLIRYYIQNKGVEYVFYDYIFSSTGLLSEYRDLKIREDVALLLLANGLKEIATENNVYVRTATQLNASGTDPNSGDKKNVIRNQNMLRGSKAVADKADVCYITMPISLDEQKKLEPVCQKLGMPMPTHVSDIYKNRRGRYTSVRVWHYFDLGTCRMEDLFVTNLNMEPINVQIVKYVFNDKIEMYDDEEINNEL